MKKVLIIIGKLCVGGAERVGRDIGFFADPAKYKIHYLVYGEEVGAYEQELTQRGCRIIHMIPPSAGYAAYWRTLTKLIREEQYDVIHCHTMFSSGWAMMAGKKYGVPIRISHSHSIRGNEKRGFVKNTYENFMRRLILRYATHLVGCGKSAGNWLYGERVFKERGILIYNGIGLDRFVFDDTVRGTIRQQLGLNDRFVIGHAGHLAPVKNQDFLLELMPLVLQNRPNAFLLLLGEGPDRGALEEKIRSLGLGDRVRLMGNVRNVHEYLSAMDVFVFPSRYEGMPLAMIEAQTNGLPCVISSNIPDDVHLTELVQALSLDEAQLQWVDTICKAKRTDPKAFAARMREMGFHTNDMLNKIYLLYEG